MKNIKIGSGIVDFLIAYCIGQCRLFGTQPFGTALLGAGCACGRSPWLCFAGLFCALLQQYGLSGGQAAVYPVIWGLAILLVRNRHLQFLYPRTFCLSVLTGVLAMTVYAGFSVYSRQAGNLASCAAESVLTFSFMLAYCFAYRSLAEDRYGFLEDTQTLLAVLIFATSVLCGMPVTIFGQVELLQTVCLISFFCVSYKFRTVAGVSWAAISGAVYALRADDMPIGAAWVFLAAAGNCIGGILHAGRHVSLILYGSIYVLLGCTVFPSLISEAGIKAGVSAFVLLALMPGAFFAQVYGNGSAAEDGSAEWGRFLLDRIREFSAAVKRIDYTFAGAQGQKIGFDQVAVLLDDFTRQLDVRVPMKKDTESGIIEKLGAHGVQLRSMTLFKGQNGQYRLYANARVGRGRLVGADTVRRIVNHETGISFEIGEGSRQTVGRNYDLIVLEQKPAFRLAAAARRLSCREDEISGDNFYIGQTRRGQALVMIADGMGSGSSAACDSREILEAVEELIDTGFAQEFAVRLVNSYLAQRNRGEHFTTLDMFLLDLCTGVGYFVKYGAAASYVCRGKWMEAIRSTSLPAGVCEDAGCESVCKKYYQNDLVVMVSDGVLDSIMFENKDDYMHALITGLADEEPDTIADAVVEDIRSVCGKRLKDDATILVCRIMKNL